MTAIKGLNKTSGYLVHEGHNIVKFRVLFGLTQRRLARLMRISQSRLSKMENTRVLKEEYKLHIANAIGIKKQFLEMSDEEIKGVLIDHFVGAEGENNVVNIANTQSNNIHPIEKVAELYEVIRAKDQEIYDLKMKVIIEENERLKQENKEKK